MLFLTDLLRLAIRSASIRSAAAFGLLIVAGCPGEAIADNSADRAAEIAAMWESRTHWGDGHFAWELANYPFGRFESNWLPSNAGDTALTATADFQFTSQAAQYRSYSTEYPSFGYQPAMQSAASDLFYTALDQKFADRSLEHREALPYQITFTAELSVHAWGAGITEYPRAIVMPPRSEEFLSEFIAGLMPHSGSSDHLSGLPSPVLHQFLALPLLLSFCPQLFDDQLLQPETWQHLDDSQKNAGLSLVVLRLNREDSADGATDWEFFLDPDCQYSVRRAVAFVNGQAMVQCDIGYDQTADGRWIPQRCVVQVLGHQPKMVRQAVVATRANYGLTAPTADSPVIRASIPSRAWVVNRQQGREYLTLNESSNATMLPNIHDISTQQSKLYTYQQIVNHAVGQPAETRSLARRQIAWQWLIKATHWPGNALVVAALATVALVLSQRLSQRRNRPYRTHEHET